MAQKRNKKAAVVQCAGGCRAKEKIPREALTGDCREALEKYPGGILECRFGCIGMGSCVAACRLGAIFINKIGTAQTDFAKCVGCGLCTAACPQGLIRLTAPEYPIYTACSNSEPGAKTKEECEAGCTACGLCAKNCPVGAIEIVGNRAVIDEEQCVACGMCAVKCPRGAIADARGIFASIG